MTKALFLTLDNTLVTTLTKQPYSIHSEDWKFVNQAVEAIRDFKERGYLIFIITNKPEITRGLISESTFFRQMELICKTLEKHLRIKPNIINYEFCVEEETYNYLPNPGMIFNLATEYQLDIVNSVLIGNSDYDKAITQYSGIKTYLDVNDLTYDI